MSTTDNNRAREFVTKALWYLCNGGHWQTVSELLSMALGEIAELEQVAASIRDIPDSPTIRVLPGRQTGGLVLADLSEVQRPLSHHEKRL